ncbi:hypothetical protein ACHAWF_013688 [Thalassiosira exigua]
MQEDNMHPRESENSTLKKSIAIVPKVGGVLSLIAYAAITRDVTTKWRKKKNVALPSVVVFCICVVDSIYSFFCPFLSTWMAPADSWPYLAAGNTQTCAAQGFINTLTRVASMTYYAVLMVLFFLIVCFGWTESYMSKRSVRLSFVLPPIVIALGMAVPPLTLQMYNEALHYSCTLVSYPAGCETAFHPDVKCIRGRGAHNFWNAVVVYSLICNGVIIASVGLLTCSVFNQERKV